MSDIRVLVVDDESVVRQGIRLILEAAPGLTVVGDASDGAEGIALTRELSPDVVMIDIRMPGVDGLSAIPTLVRLGARTLVLTTYDLDENLQRAFQAGASGFMLKTSHPDDLVHGVRVVHRGDALVEPRISRRLIEAMVSRTDPRRRPRWADRLTDREEQVLRWMASGLSNAEIAERLYLSEATVKTHVAGVLGRLGVRDRLQAVVLAYETGFVVPGEGEAEC